MWRYLAATGVAALAGCVFDTSGLTPAADRRSPSVEAASIDRSKVAVDLLSDAPGRDAPRSDAPAELPKPDGPRSDLEPSDLKPSDVNKLDQKKADQKKTDLPKPDQKKTDLPKADQKKTDLPKADQKKTDLPKADQKKTDLPKPDLPPPTCQSLFGSTPGYTACTATTLTSCRFYFASGTNQSCTQICGSHACLKAEDNASGQKCVLETPNTCGSGPCTCSSSIGDGICTCAK